MIARCDELWTVGGGLPAGGGGSLEETIRRGIAYADAGADVFLPTLITADQVPLVAAEVPIPLTAFGKLLEGLSFSRFAGWGTFSAGRNPPGIGPIPLGSWRSSSRGVGLSPVRPNCSIRPATTWLYRTGVGAQEGRYERSNVCGGGGGVHERRYCINEGVVWLPYPMMRSWRGFRDEPWITTIRITTEAYC